MSSLLQRHPTPPLLLPYDLPVPQGSDGGPPSPGTEWGLFATPSVRLGARLTCSLRRKSSFLAPGAPRTW